MKKLRVSLIGHGHLGKWHAQKISTFENIEFFGIADKFYKESSLEDLYPQLRITDSYESLIDESDAFIVVTPTNTHFQICKELIKNKKHVFCEKPVTTNSLESNELLNLAKEYNVKFFVGHSERCHQAWEVLDFKEAKNILFERFTMPKNRAYDVSVVEDLMVHDIDLFHFLFKYQAASLVATGKVHHTGLLDEVSVNIKTSCGELVTIKANRNCDSEKRSLCFKREEDLIEVDLLNLKILKKNKEIKLEKRDHLLIEQGSFYQHILTGSKALTTLSDGHSAMKIIDAIHLSIREGREVFL